VIPAFPISARPALLRRARKGLLRLYAATRGRCPRILSSFSDPLRVHKQATNFRNPSSIRELAGPPPARRSASKLSRMVCVIKVRRCPPGAQTRRCPSARSRPSSSLPSPSRRTRRRGRPRATRRLWRTSSPAALRAEAGPPAATTTRRLRRDQGFTRGRRTPATRTTSTTRTRATRPRATTPSTACRREGATVRARAHAHRARHTRTTRVRAAIA